MTRHVPETAARVYIKKDEAALYLQCTTRTIENMISDGRLKAYSLGPRIVRLDRNEIDAVMEAGGHKG